MNYEILIIILKTKNTKCSKKTKKGRKNEKQQQKQTVSRMMAVTWRKGINAF